MAAARFKAAAMVTAYHCMTVTRFTVILFAVLTRTMYMPLLNWAMFRVYSSALTSVSNTT